MVSQAIVQFLNVAVYRSAKRLQFGKTIEKRGSTALKAAATLRAPMFAKAERIASIRLVDCLVQFPSLLHQLLPNGFRLFQPNWKFIEVFANDIDNLAPGGDVHEVRCLAQRQLCAASAIAAAVHLPLR
jgi:hypothetical protein